jgi:hypothetical protein
MFLQVLEDLLEKECTQQNADHGTENTWRGYCRSMLWLQYKDSFYLKLNIPVTDTTSDIFTFLYRLGNSQQS